MATTETGLPGVTPPAGPRRLSRIAIVNRGEPAMRLINAVRELRLESGAELTTIALHTGAEADATFVREADEAVTLGPTTREASPYLDLDVLAAALIAARADAAWVGWGFVAERPEFAELCARLGVTFVGPRPEVMRQLGDKIGAKLLAERAGVPVAAWSDGAVESVEEARTHAERIGFPLMIKAAAGGGGRGIRRVDAPGGLAAAFESARSEGAKAFGDPTVFLERVVTDARHVEVQIVGDEHGTVVAFGVRDCSVQRRNQKVIEESACTAMTAAEDADLRAAAVRLGELAGYTNAGTVEFLFQPNGRRFAFLEVNTRLQVEHPVTELTTGVDLVKLQLHVAAGGRLDPTAPAPRGHAVEARLNAEDPQNEFAPAPGTVETLTFPVGPGIRVDTGIAEGDVVSPDFDSMVAKVIAHGSTRPEALARLRRALEQTVAVIAGGTTNRSFLLGLLQRPEVLAGDVDTGWLDRLTARDEHRDAADLDVALVAAAIGVADGRRADEVERFLDVASRGRPAVDNAVGVEVELRSPGAGGSVVLVRELGPRCYAVHPAGDATTRRPGVVVEVVSSGTPRRRMRFGSRVGSVVTTPAGAADVVVEVDRHSHRFSRDEVGVVRAPAAALVVGVDVAPGDRIAAGARVAVVEAMKMEIAVSAPVAGLVTAVMVTRNAQVDAGAPLVRIDTADGNTDPGRGATAEAPSLDQLAELTAARHPSAADTLQAFMLGFDVSRSDADRAVGELFRSGTSVLDAARDALVAFADVCALATERRTPDADDGTQREYLNAYLRTLDPEREGLPAWYVERLRRALAHYAVGLDDDPSSPMLGAALRRIVVSGTLRAEQAAIVSALLDAELGAPPDGHTRPGRGATPEDDRRREVLDRIIDATRRRHPAVASLARGSRFRLFDRPALDLHLTQVYDSLRPVRDRLVTAAAGPHPADIDTLVACPLPLMSLLAEGGRFEPPADTTALLGVLTQRYYKIRQPSPIVPVDTGTPAVRAVHTEYRNAARTVKVFAASADISDLVDALGRLAARAAEVELPAVAVVDLYVSSATAIDTDQLAAAVATALAAVTLPALVRRVAAIAAPPTAPGQVLTFRRTGDSTVRPYWMLDDADEEEQGRADRFVEDVRFRGLHPMIARRLQMWRLSNFEITRLPSADDVYTFGCVGRDNPSDQRVIAVGEVRDLTPLRDASGAVVSVPGVEHVLTACLDSIRQAQRTPGGRGGRLEWNRVLLFVWPTVEFSLEEVDAVVRRLAPLTEGAGVEQVVVSARFPDPAGGERETALRLGYDPGRGLTARFTPPPTEPMQPLDDFTRKRIQARRRGLTYPYEIVPMLAGPGGTFVEHDLADTGELTPVERPAGGNRAGVIVGVVTTPTSAHAGGWRRVAILGDPTKAMGSITEAECRRILAAIDLAERMEVPIDWFALSAGAKIAMDSGSENLDWVARVLRRLVEHTQRAGRSGEVNIVVAGINVGAQPYWNAEATMLMHTAGILVMTPDSAMVLTGKQAIDYSGGVSAEDNLGIGGYARIMGPNGEAQYFTPTIAGACELLFRHYQLTYVEPGERWARPAATADPVERDVSASPHAGPGTDFTTVGEIFDPALNRDRKKPFDVRSVMRAVVDADQETLERWSEMAEAEGAVVWDARLGGHAVTVIGIESRPLPRHGSTPADGPAQWSAGTLFPLSSKKVARAINAASGRRPVVVLANLSGFDGSPESLRRLQLEYGAEIGRAIVNFDGPFVLCVISRYHGGAFVVFSATLNDHMEVLAVEGSYASVIGGAPAAAVVFTREVEQRTDADERVAQIAARLTDVPEADADAVRALLTETRDAVRAEKLGEVAAEFDAIHSVERAREVGSVHRIIAPGRLRPELIAAVERGIAKFDG